MGREGSRGRSLAGVKSELEHVVRRNQQLERGAGLAEARELERREASEAAAAREQEAAEAAEAAAARERQLAQEAAARERQLAGELADTRAELARAKVEGDRPAARLPERPINGPRSIRPAFVDPCRRHVRASCMPSSRVQARSG